MDEKPGRRRRLRRKIRELPGEEPGREPSKPLPLRIAADYVLTDSPVSDFEPRPLEWLWPGRIPLGSLTLIAGDEGAGKSLLALDLAARVTWGRSWPDRPDQPQPDGNVLILAAHEPLLGTMMPRLMKAGGDLERTFFADGLESQVWDFEAKPGHLMKDVYDGKLLKFETGLTRRMRFPHDLRTLQHTIDDHYPLRLVIIDPLWAFCGGDRETRERAGPALLAPLAELAARCETAIVGITGLRRDAGRGTYRADGSRFLTQAASMAFAVVRRPKERDRRVFLPIKTNLGPEPVGLEFRIVDGRIRWDATETKLTAETLISAERPGSALERTESWLQMYLSQGSRPARDVFSQAEEFGVSLGTLKRAKKRLRIESQLLGQNGDSYWAWSLGEQTDV